MSTFFVRSAPSSRTWRDGLGLSPTHLTIIGGAAGVAGGALLYEPRLGLLGFALLILHSIFDSSDGQLARLTGQSTELGRLLDGVAGYATFTAVYSAIAAGVVRDGGSPLVFLAAALAALSNVAQAQMYDYHRTSYATIAIKGQVPQPVPSPIGPAWARMAMRAVPRGLQRRLIGLHGDVEAAIAARPHQETVSDEDRARYRRVFYWPVRGWNRPRRQHALLRDRRPRLDCITSTGSSSSSSCR